MTNAIRTGIAAVLLSWRLAIPAAAEPLEEGSAAYSRGDYATAMRLWQPLADEGNAEAQHWLGLMYRDGRGVSQDYAAALSWFQKAADQGDAAAQINLGGMFARAQGVRGDHATAVRPL